MIWNEDLLLHEQKIKNKLLACCLFIFTENSLKIGSEQPFIFTFTNIRWLKGIVLKKL